MTAPTRSDLRAHLVASRIAGDVDTPRSSNITNARRMAERDPRYLFGLEPEGVWEFEDVLALMAARVGISPDVAYEGVDRIDPDATIDRLDAMAVRLAQAADRRERVLVATGHPAGLLAVHLGVAAALLRAGATVLTPAAGAGYQTLDGSDREIRHLGGVLMVSSRGELRHTHSATPVHLALAALAEERQDPPDLVVGDHGWAGGAAQAGVDTVGFADSNDPALFVGEAEGRVSVCVPLDDNVLPHLYEPLTAHLVAGLRGRR